MGIQYHPFLNMISPAKNIVIELTNDGFSLYLAGLKTGVHRSPILGQFHWENSG